MNIFCLKNLRKLIIIACVSVIPSISKAQNTQINEKGFVNINGIEQWVTIKGERSKPVILFLHGGPGSPLSPYADSIFKGWEKQFILVQWDQRGAGKTFGRTAPDKLTPDYLKSNPLTVEKMTQDGIELSEYLIKHLGKQKIILFGTSWGSVLGIQMVQKRPELFYTYIGHAQVVHSSSDNLKLAYQKVYQLAQKANDQKSLAMLDSLGNPPYARARKSGQLLRIIKKYERLNSKPEPEAWFNILPEYDNEKDNQHRSDGDDYSFVYFVGDKQLGIQPMVQPRNSLTFRLPIYFIQGEEDILTPKEVTKKYFDQIHAPGKEFILLPMAAHGFNTSVIETLFNICKKIKQ